MTTLLHADTDDRVIPFAAYTAAQTPNAFSFSMGRKTAKIAPNMGGSRPSSTTWFVGST